MKGQKGANKKEEGEVREQTKGEEKMKEGARGDYFNLLKTYPKNRKPDTSREPVLCLTVDEDDDREAISSSSSSNLRDRQLRNMQRVGEVTKAIEVLNLGEKGGGGEVKFGHLEDDCLFPSSLGFHEALVVEPEEEENHLDCFRG